MHLLSHILSALFVMALAFFPLDQMKAQCSGASLNGSSFPVCPGNTRSYSLQNVPANYSITWSTGSYGSILSGQGTQSVTVQWNFPGNCGGCPMSNFTVHAILDENGGPCLDQLSFAQPYSTANSAPLIYGATSVHSGDTSWYMAEYFDGTNNFPSGDFTGLQGGTILASRSVSGMGSPTTAQYVQKYLQVLWGNTGQGGLEFAYFDGGGGCPDTSGITVSIGPSGNIDPKIIGPEYVCMEDTVTFMAELHPNSTYQWHTPGGFIVSGQGTPQVQVAYTGGSSFPNIYYNYRGQVFLTETNNGYGSTIHKQIAHSSIGNSTIPILYGPSSVCNNSQSRYYASAEMDVYTWTVTGGSIVSGQGTDSIVVQWPFFGTGTGTVSFQSQWGCCCGTSRTMNVAYGAPIANYPQLIAASIANLGATITYSTPFVNGHTYNWSVSAGGSILSGQGTNSIQVQWNQPGSQTVTIHEDGPSCGLNSQTANVNVISFAIEVHANDSTLQTGYGPQQCATLSVVTLPNASFPNYLWSTGATTPTITVCPSTTTTYACTVTDFTLGQASDDVLVEVEDLNCGANGGVTICRNLGLFTFTQCVQPLMVPTYLAQGSTLGSCVNKNFSHSAPTFAFEVYPNPSAGFSEVFLSVSQAGTFEVDLMDLEGRVIETLLSEEMEDGEIRKMRIGGGDLAAGMYLLRLRGEGIFEVIKWNLL